MSSSDISAPIAYAARSGTRQRYYANDHSRDTVVIDPRVMPIADARELSTSLDREGFILVPHASKVRDFEDAAEVAAVHPAEIVELITSLTGADDVRVTAPGILRFSENSGRAGSHDNSHPARFAHIDATAQTSASFAALACPQGRALARYAHFNVWRAISGAPQDVSLAICDATSISPDDRHVADAVFDAPGREEWSFESWIVGHNPAHRWYWFPALSRDEAIVFKSSDSQFHNAVPHVAFDTPPADETAIPRVSIEMRAIAMWYR